MNISLVVYVSIQHILSSHVCSMFELFQCVDISSVSAQSAESGPVEILHLLREGDQVEETRVQVRGDVW